MQSTVLCVEVGIALTKTKKHGRPRRVKPTVSREIPSIRFRAQKKAVRLMVVQPL